MSQSYTLCLQGELNYTLSGTRETHDHANAIRNLVVKDLLDIARRIDRMDFTFTPTEDENGMKVMVVELNPTPESDSITPLDTLKPSGEELTLTDLFTRFSIPPQPNPPEESENAE